MGLTERKLHQTITDSTTTAGQDNDAKLKLGPFRRYFTVFYDVDTSDDAINIETSNDDSSWDTHTTIQSADIVTGGTEDAMLLGETEYNYVRVYAGSSFNDADVTIVRITSKGG